MTLSERHLQELVEGSGIPLEVIQERGCWTAKHPSELQALGFADYQCRAPALVFPLHGPDESNGRYAIKPDHPRTGKDGRVRKYDYPAGTPNMLDVPPRCIEQLANSSVPLLFTEGAKKSDCLAGLGYCVVNIWGVHSWYTNPQHGGFQTIEEIADWEAIKPTLPGREVYLVFDSDAFTKASVGLALRRLISHLERFGALVYVVRLPDSENGDKLGVDDFVVRYGAEALAALVEDAEPEGREAMRREIRALRDERSAIFKVLHNDNLTAGERIVAVSAVCMTQSRISRGHRGPIRVTVDAPKHPENPLDVERVGLAAEIGLSKNTVRRALDRVFAPGAPIVKHTRPSPPAADGTPRMHIELEAKCPTSTPGMLWSLAGLKPPKIEPKPPRQRCIVEMQHPHAFTETCTVTGLVEEWERNTPRTQNEHQDGAEAPDTQNEYLGDTTPLEASGLPSSVLNDTILGTRGEDAVAVFTVAEAPAPRVAPTGRCPGCGESWTPRPSSAATQCGVCSFYAAQQASAAVLA